MHEQFDAAGIEAKSSLNAAVLIPGKPPRSFVGVVLHLLSVPHAKAHHRRPLTWLPPCHAAACNRTRCSPTPELTTK